MPTAIVRIYTPEGYVIASDSKTTATTTGITQKIFSATLHAHECAYSIGGSAVFGLPVLFDFTEEVKRHLEATSTEDRWDMTLYSAAKSLAYEFNQMRQSHPGFAMSGIDNTYVFVDGYDDVGPHSSLLKFQHGPQETYPVSDPEEFAVGQIRRYGSNFIGELLKYENERVAAYARPRRKEIRDLMSAKLRANNEILAQCDDALLCLDPKGDSLAIGPPVQMATLTPSRGFEWVEGFSPS